MVLGCRALVPLSLAYDRWDVLGIFVVAALSGQSRMGLHCKIFTNPRPAMARNEWPARIIPILRTGICISPSEAP